MSAAPFVDARNLQRVFNVSKPWLNRVLEGGHLEFLKAVNDVTFDIVKGETFALVGESGSGKTTVARMVVGLLPPTSGEVIIDGVSMTDPKQAQARKALRRRIQMIFRIPTPVSIPGSASTASSPNRSAPSTSSRANATSRAASANCSVLSACIPTTA